MSAVVERLSVAEYLARERAAETKHEYIDGETIEMTGGSAWHGLIAGNVGRYVGLRLRSIEAFVFPSDVRVACPSGLIAYPDASVVVGTLELLDDVQDTLLNPRAIFEVLSPSTERYDRGKKFEHYGTIPTLREYVLVAQGRPSVERFVRDSASAAWRRDVASDPSGAIELTSLGISLPLSEIYERVSFLTDPASPA